MAQVIAGFLSDEDGRAIRQAAAELPDTLAVLVQHHAASVPPLVVDVRVVDAQDHTKVLAAGTCPLGEQRKIVEFINGVKEKLRPK